MSYSFALQCSMHNSHVKGLIVSSSKFCFVLATAAMFAILGRTATSTSTVRLASAVSMSLSVVAHRAKPGSLSMRDYATQVSTWIAAAVDSIVVHP